jgi:signal transduction histidine kinase
MMTPTTSNLRRRIAAAVLLLSAYTVLTAAFPRLQISLFSPDLRIIIETVGLSVALFTALALLLPDQVENVIERNAFVVALVVLGVSDAVFGILPVLVRDPATTDGAVGFYPWLLSRYAAGLLFIAASIGRPRLRLRTYLLLTLAALAAADAATLAIGGGAAPTLQELEDMRGGVSVEPATVWDAVLITAAPGVLFAVGATLAWRVFGRTSSPLYLWLSFALWIQVLAQVHEVLYPAVLGPTITSADMFSFLVLLMLLCGAVLKVRSLWQERRAALVMQHDDLREQQQELETAQAFVEQEEAFRSLVVHELATPIATLRAYVHVLAEQAHEGDPLVQRALGGLESESARLQALVARMEELRAIEGNDMMIVAQPVLLLRLLEDVARFLNALPGSRRVMIDCEDVRARVDPVRMGQALRNMATNAARYAPEGTVVVLSGQRAEPGRVHIAVSDQGPGIPADERVRLQQKYQRGTAASGQEGAGLGLYLSRRIAEAHGGRLFIRDGEDGRGARVVIEVDQA